MTNNYQRENKMNLQDIKRLVQQGEGKTIEFKRKITNAPKVIREVVAFANTDGGYLIVGVDDDQTIPGLRFPEEEDFVLRQAIADLCRPKISFESLKIPLNAKKAVLCYKVTAGDRKPYYAFEKKHHRYGKAFVRVEDRTVQASPEIRKILKFENDPRDVQFSYGENEKILFNFLSEHAYITLKKFQEITGLGYKPSSNILVQMVTANALRIEPHESGDWYFPVEYKTEK